jgi:hypothetical protein
MAGQEVVWNGVANLQPNQPGPIWFKPSGEHRFPSRQLFAKQPRFALPSLDVAHPSEGKFYSSLGQMFRNTPPFGVDQSAGRIVFNNGTYRALIGRRASEGALCMERLNGQAVAYYKIPDADADARAMFGALFDHNDNIFCYSTEPGYWQVLAPRAETQTLRTQFSEQPVSIRAKSGGHEVRIWSDARYGGDGSVRLEQHQNGEILSSRAHFNFDEIGGTVGKYQILPDSSAWAAVISDEGDPLALVRCRRGRKSRTYTFQSYDLEELRADAQLLKVSVQFD